METDVIEQQKFENKIQTSVENAVNDLRYEIKFGNHVKNKNNFLIKQEIFFFKQKYRFFDSWKIIFLRILRIQLRRHFFAEADTRKHMPRQKPWHLRTADVNFDRCVWDFFCWYLKGVFKGIFMVHRDH